MCCISTKSCATLRWCKSLPFVAKDKGVERCWTGLDKIFVPGSVARRSSNLWWHAGHQCVFCRWKVAAGRIGAWKQWSLNRFLHISVMFLFSGKGMIIPDHAEWYSSPSIRTWKIHTNPSVILWFPKGYVMRMYLAHCPGVMTSPCATPCECSTHRGLWLCL